MEDFKRRMLHGITHVHLMVLLLLVRGGEFCIEIILPQRRV